MTPIHSTRFTALIATLNPYEEIVTRANFRLPICIT
jgi:hypothetical protein